MSAGTLTLTNQSAVVVGSGTVFTTDLAAGDFVVVTVGGVPYTLPVKTVNSATSLTLISNFTGPTQAGAAWSAVPRLALNMVTAALVTQSAEALRGLNYDKQNWQQVFSGTGTITVKLPDGTTYSGLAWGGIASTIDGKLSKSSNLSDLVDKAVARQNLGWISGALPLSLGGTGATGDTGARQNLGLGSSATLNTTSSDNDAATGLVMRSGNYGLGGIGASYTNNDSTGFLNSIKAYGSQFARNNGTAGGTFRYAAGIYAHCGDAHAFLSMDFATGNTRVLVATDSTLAAGTTYTNNLYGTANTTRASDGTLKAASPVVQIFHDGRSLTNAESEGCTVRRMGVGEYLLEGCVGLNSDAAWGGIDGGFDIPKDRNRQPLVWLDYEVNANGSVLIKTYHRTHPDAPAFARNLIGVKGENGMITETILNGEPIDIPSDQFISVRVEMPVDSAWNQMQESARQLSEAAFAQEKLRLEMNNQQDGQS